MLLAFSPPRVKQRLYQHLVSLNNALRCSLFFLVIATTTAPNILLSRFTTSSSLLTSTSHRDKADRVLHSIFSSALHNHPAARELQCEARYRIAPTTIALCRVALLTPYNSQPFPLWPYGCLTRRPPRDLQPRPLLTLRLSAVDHHTSRDCRYPPQADPNYHDRLHI